MNKRRRWKAKARRAEPIQTKRFWQLFSNWGKRELVPIISAALNEPTLLSRALEGTLGPVTGTHEPTV